MSPNQTIHNYEKLYAQSKERLKNSNIKKRNKDLIIAFERDCSLKENLSLATILKYYDVLMTLAKKTNKDFDKFAKEDYEILIEKVERRTDITISTKQKFRAILKKFGRWLSYGDKIFGNGYKEYPNTVSWINTNIKKKDMPKIRASDILTEEEINKLISLAEHPRDKAFISMLYETGSRIGEIGNLHIKDVSEHEHGFIIDLAKGKTGTRTVIIVYHASKLANWLNQHPLKDNLNAPLWVSSYHKDIRQLSYSALKRVIQRVASKSGIKKRIYPHLFRHSRVTHLLNKNELNETQAKVYFGWAPDSKMLGNYSHLTSRDVNNVMLRLAGIEEKEKDESMKVNTCHYCNKPNEPNMKYCGFCGKPLTMDTILNLESMKNKISGLSLGHEKSEKLMKDYLKEVLMKELKKK